MPNFVKSDSRISELVLGGSRGDSAFMRVNVSDDFGTHKGFNGFGLGYNSRPPTTQLETTKSTRQTLLTEEINKQQVTDDIKEGQESAVVNHLKDAYFNKQHAKVRKRRKAEDD